MSNAARARVVTVSASQYTMIDVDLPYATVLSINRERKATIFLLVNSLKFNVGKQHVAKKLSCY